MKAASIVSTVSVTSQGRSSKSHNASLRAGSRALEATASHAGLAGGRGAGGQMSDDRYLSQSL